MYVPARKRIMAYQIVESDAFYMLGKDAQLLYFHLLATADNEGFIGNCDNMRRILNIETYALYELVRRGFLLYFSKEKVIVIKHWLIHNPSKFLYTADFTYPELADKIYVEKSAQYTLRKCDGIVNLADFRVAKKKLGCRSPIETIKHLANADIDQILGRIRKDKKKDEDVDADNDVESDKKLMSHESAQTLENYEVVYTSMKEGRKAVITASLRTATAEEIISKDREPSDEEYRLFGSDNVKNVKLTQTQATKLYRDIGVSNFNYYVGKLSDFIVEKGADELKNHYGLIMKWAREDGKTT